MIGIMLVFYMTLVACQRVWTNLLFDVAYSGTINESFYRFMTFYELVSFMVFRTRSTLKYAPKFLSIFHVMFLYYHMSYVYPAGQEAFAAMNYLSITVILIFILRYELPAVTEWNPCGSYTPSESNPRCGYHHVLSSYEYGYGFDVFSLS